MEEFQPFLSQLSESVLKNRKGQVRSSNSRLKNLYILE